MARTKEWEEAKKGERRIAVRTRGECAEVRRTIGREQRAHRVVRKIVRKGE